MYTFPIHNRESGVVSTLINIFNRVFNRESGVFHDVM